MFGVEPITMSPTAAIVTIPVGAALCTTAARRTVDSSGFAFELVGAGAAVALADTGRGAPSTRSETMNPIASTTAPARRISASGLTAELAAVAEEDERVVRELCQRGEGGGDIRQRRGAEHLARAVRLAAGHEPE